MSINLEDPAHPQASAPGANLEDVPTMEDVLEQTAAAILGLDPDYSTQEEIETARRAALAALSQTGGDSVAIEMVERAAALLLGGIGCSLGSAYTESVAIDEHVSIGPYSLSSNLDKLQALGVTAVVSVDAARPPLFGASPAPHLHEMLTVLNGPFAAQSWRWRTCVCTTLSGRTHRSQRAWRRFGRICRGISTRSATLSPPRARRPRPR